MAEEQKKNLEQVYKEKNLQRLTLSEYMALQEEQEKRAKVKVPFAIKVLMVTPFILVFCFGLFFIPFMIYVVFISPDAPPPSP